MSKQKKCGGNAKQKKSDPNYGKSRKGLDVKNRWKKKLSHLR